MKPSDMDIDTAQVMISAFIAGFSQACGGAEACNPEQVRAMFWEWAPTQLELERMALGELNAWLDQALGEAGVPANRGPDGKHGRADFDRMGT